MLTEPRNLAKRERQTQETHMLTDDIDIEGKYSLGRPEVTIGLLADDRDGHLQRPCQSPFADLPC